jgi:hypothetical protein
VYRGMLYYIYCLHKSWHKYTTCFFSLHVLARWGHLQVHWGLQSPVSLSATLPTLASVYIGSGCMYGPYMPYTHTPLPLSLLSPMFLHDCAQGNISLTSQGYTGKWFDKLVFLRWSGRKGPFTHTHCNN